MTDRPRPYHRAEAERLLDYADEWAAQAEEPMPEAGELSCLAYAAVHALLAIADRLAVKPCETCARRDAYAAREAEQRAAAAHEYEWVYVEGAVEKCRPNPLDESDHRDRLDTDGDRLSRRANGLWSFWDEVGMFTLASAEERYGPLRFAVDEPQEAASSHDTPPSTPAGPQGGLWDGSKSQRRNLNAQRGETDDGVLRCDCGHDIDDHNGDPDEPHTWCAGCDDCRQTPGTIAQALLRAARATTAGANQ